MKLNFKFGLFCVLELWHKQTTWTHLGKGDQEVLATYLSTEVGNLNRFFWHEVRDEYKKTIELTL